jgi:hypothetical protein
MELRDLIVTPVIIALVYMGAYLVRPYVTDEITRKYFLPALTVRIIGALAVGFIYQFYYDGGDTFAYHTFGSRVIWEAFIDSPVKGLQLLLSNGNYEYPVFEYASRIWYYRDPQSYFLIRISAIFDLITFSTYSGTAVLFAVVGFSGSWALFRTFYKAFPEAHTWTAVACLFIPTVCFWGSGIFKDTVAMAALGWCTYAFYTIAIESRMRPGAFVLLGISMWLIFSIKKYILLSFLPALIVWLALQHTLKVRSIAARLLIIPISFILALLLGYYAISKVGEDDARYDVEKLAATAKMTAYDIRYGWGARTGEGSGYSLGELDGSWQSMIRLAPAAINASLFRPYLWEISNPLMLLSGLESFGFLLITIYVTWHSRGRLISSLSYPAVTFCIVFSLIFAFAVGVATYNFGTLSRYKIPLEPFYLVGLGLIQNYSKRDKKFEALEVTE